MELTGIRSARDLGQAASTAAAKGDQELGKNAFLELMVAQFNNQNPLEPTKNEDFIAQLAQFSSLEGIQNLNTSMEKMAAAMFSATAVQAAGLVGRSVLAPASRAMTEGSGLAGNVVNAQSGSEVVVEVSDAAGSFVRRLNLGAQANGDVRFAWDGAGENGEQLPAGVYRFRAYALSGEEPVQLEVQLPERVASVSFENGQTSLNLAGGASVQLSDIRELQ